ncbi:hypothetical protein FE257_009037 [Aspergillus nanangensis]|uniref:Ras modification protein ERF4 n=1 Tax=Aspergillus nanangensis TaxID=2582783 RepID=A0AAD4CWL0_ASPNN|nr:hypothetical protein FE257_009037 [Aspergillus nanangensis]
MRLASRLVLLAFLVSSLLVFALRIPLERNQHGVFAVIEARETAADTTATAEHATTTENDSARDKTASVTGHATATATATTNTTSTSNKTIPATTTLPSLSTSDGTNATAGALPLQPTVTPALGVGGFILLAAGAVLALIGIRNLWVQVFLSTAFLTSLGVTVLIVYVMNPPVRVAVQGAYLVAVFFTGITFGALSIVFKELTEGLGCLLGGFCISMWLLCLKPGGLLTESNPKSGFIGAISVGIYALSFSHYTRPYALMGSTAAAGGTAVALGIDCFSRAGLKEFWLYVWALNDDIFPLHTETYPVTRNIRVELAATVIIAILGIISQLRLWNVVRERRRKEDELRAEEQRKKDEAEAEVGRRLEENNMKERLAWEAQYGSSGGPDIPELGTNSRTCLADEKIDIEKADKLAESFTSSSEGSYRCSDCREREENGESAYARSDISDSIDDSEDAEGSDTELADGDGLKRSSDEKKAVPRKVFDGAAAARMKEDNSSEVTAIIGSEAGTIRSKRFSGRSILDRMSVRSTAANPMSESQEALVSCADDASSTHDIMDEEDSDTQTIGDKKPGEEQKSAQGDMDTKTVPKAIDNLEPHHENTSDTNTDVPAGTVDEPSVYSREVEETKEKPQDTPTPDNENVPTLSIPENNNAEHEGKAEKTAETSKQAEAPVEAPKPDKQKVNKCLDEKPSQEKPSKEAADTNVDNSSSESSNRSPSPVEQSEVSVARSSEGKERSSGKRKSSKSKGKSKSKKEDVKLDKKAVKQLPQRSSRVVQSYRTNEWAKHLADAEAPEPEPIQPVEEEEPECLVEKEETAAPVNVEQLLQTPLNAQPPPAIERHDSVGKPPSSANEEHLVSDDFQRRRSSKSKKQNSRSSNRLSGQSLTSTSNTPPPLTLDTQIQPVQGPSSGVYNIPTPLPPIADIVEQPREETEPPKPQWVGPPPLIAVREGLMQNKLSSFSLSTDPWSSRMSPGIPSPRSSPLQSTFPALQDGDNIPLSQRRSILHQQQTQRSASTSSPNPPARWSQNSAPATVTSPIAAVTRRESSVRENVYNNRGAVTRHSSMVGTAPSPYGQPQRSTSSINIDQAIAQGMQRGDMSNLHRDVMRRMQAKANQKVNHGSSSRSRPRHRKSWIPPAILRPPAVHLANPVNYVPRITPVTLPHPLHISDDNLPLETHRDAYPLLSIPERRRSRVSPSLNSLVVERSQGETESERSSIALPRGQRRSGGFGERWTLQEMSEQTSTKDANHEASNLRTLDTVSDAQGPLDERPRHVRSQTSLRSQSQIASIPSHTAPPIGADADVPEELAWGPAHPCYPHINPHVPLGSSEYLTTRVIRIRRDWMVRGDLAPAYSNLYPEILDPLLPEQEFRKVVAMVNDELVKAFDPFSFRNWIDGALGLITGWLWEDIGAPGVKSHLKRVEDGLEKWNREVGNKDGVHIWSLRRTAYMSLDIQIPDPKVGIIPSEGGPSLPGTRPNSGIQV